MTHSRLAQEIYVDSRRRRLAIAALLGSAAGLNVASERIFIVGVLGVFSYEEENDVELTAELKRRGYVMGRNLRIVSRACGNELNRLDVLAAELVAMKVDLILSTGGTPSALAAKRATSTIPIVMSARDPVEDGLVRSLAEPGGNVTGSADIGEELAIKRLELLIEAARPRGPLGYLIHPRIQQRQSERKTIAAMEAYMAARGGSLVVASVREVAQGDDIEYGLSLLTKQGVFAAVINNYSTIGAGTANRVAGLLLQHRMASIMEARAYALGGVLMTYSEPPKYSSLRSAGFIDRILRGAKPSDLPIERPDHFELVINLKTATSLGITIPTPVLTRADEVIS